MLGSGAERWGSFLIAGAGVIAIGAPPSVEGELWGPRSREIFDGEGGEIHGFAFDGDWMGHSLAVGDFNGDGRDDLAIADYETIDEGRAGAVHVRYSAAGGGLLFQTKWRDFNPANGDSDVDAGDEFGEALAVGDFDGNGFDDLAIGIPGDEIAGAFPGAVLVLYGSPVGLASNGNPPAEKFLSPHFGQRAATGDRFGDALAAGDFDGDGRDDLAIGVPFGDVNGIADAGRVIVAYGRTALGLGLPDSRSFDQDSSGVEGEMQDAAEVGDRFGSALATGDFNADGRDDLAIGVPGESVAGRPGAGIAQVLYGSSSPGLKGLRLTNNQAWNELNIAAGGTLEQQNEFGSVLAAGDLTGDRAAELAIGVPKENLFEALASGAVTVMYGQPGVGLHPANAVLIDQLDLRKDTAEPSTDLEMCGASLAIGDFVDDAVIGSNNLVIGISRESVHDPGGPDDFQAAGAFVVVPGGLPLDPGSARFWAPGLRGAVGLDSLGPALYFAESLAAGDFDGDGEDDLAAGAIGYDGDLAPGDPAVNSGAVYLFFGALFADNFEIGTTEGWDDE